MKIKSLLLVLFIGCHALSVSGQAEKLLGVWQTDDQTASIEFYKSGSTYAGRIVWLAQPNGPDGLPLVDRRNPDPAKRSRKILGLTIISGLTFNKNAFSSGTIYAPKRGQYAKCAIKVKADNQLSITVSSGLFSDTKTWTKK